LCSSPSIEAAVASNFTVCATRQVFGRSTQEDRNASYGGEVHNGYWCGNARERDHLENLGVDRRIILKLIFRLGWESVDCIYLVQEREKRRAVVNTVMNFRVP
jgi:hypothetical protein